MIQAGPDCADCSCFSWPRGWRWRLRRFFKGPYDFKLRRACRCSHLCVDNDEFCEDARRVGGDCGPDGRFFIQKGKYR